MIAFSKQDAKSTKILFVLPIHPPARPKHDSGSATQISRPKYTRPMPIVENSNLTIHYIVSIKQI